MQRMDIKINGNLNIQNDYLKSGYVETDGKASRQSVIERNADAFKRVASHYYDKSNTYTSTGESTKEATEATETELLNATMTECIDSLKSLVTPEDYSQLEAWGLIPDEDNPESFVTVYERIQIELATYCDDYDASSLNINKDKLKSVLGSEAMANAVDKAKDVAKTGGKLSDDAKRYIIENNLAPSIENIYKATYSGASATGASKLTAEQWQQLTPQVQKFFETNGIEVSQDKMETAKWLVSEKLPLTVENFNKLSSMEKIDFSDEGFMDKLSENISYTIYFGGDGMSTDMTGSAFNVEKINEAVNTVQSAMDADVDYILKNNKKLNIENLKQRIEVRKKEQAEKNREKSNADSQELVVRNKVLIEARAILTAGSLFMMQKAGIDISYTEITVMVDMTVTSNNQLADAIFMLDGQVPTDDDRQILTQTMSVMAGFSSLPIGVAGKVFTGEISYTASAVYTEGTMMTARYKMAAESYETLGTEIRSDLGDNITKAFRNLDDVLTAEGVELNDENRRAARVLSYNSLEITVESVTTVGQIVSNLDALTKNLTPKAAVHLIRNGINPLGMNIEELNERLVEINEQVKGEDDNLKYSEYLWKLEKNKNISADEREAYIQLYRVMEHINKQDGSAVLATANAGKELTLANLYSAARTMRGKGIDKKVDDALGVLESGYSEDALTTYMENAAKIMADDELHGQYKYQTMQEKIDTILKGKTLTEQELMRVVSGLEGSSVNNIYTAMMASDSQFSKKAKGLTDDKISAELQKVSNLWEEADEPSEEQVVASYMNLKVSAEGENNEKTYEAARLRTDITAAVSFMARQAESRSYYVPMEISGDTTMVHMTFKQGSENQRGRISIYAETAGGKISVLMTKTSQSYSINVATDSEALKEKMELLMEGTVVVSESVSDGMWSEMAESVSPLTSREDTTYSELVRQAKSFIHNVLKHI